MNRVDAGHDPVEQPKDLRLRWKVAPKMRARPKMFDNIIVILDAFNCQKSQGQKNCDDQESELPSEVILARRVDSERHRQAAGQKNCCVHGSEENDGMMA